MRHSSGRTPLIAISIGFIAGSPFTGAGGAAAAQPPAVIRAAASLLPAGVWTRVTGSVGDIGESSFARNGTVAFWVRATEAKTNVVASASASAPSYAATRISVATTCGSPRVP